MLKEYIIVSAVCATSIILLTVGFILAGNPLSQQAIKYDYTRLSDFDQIEAAINNYYSNYGTLPASMAQLKSTAGSYLSIQDPETRRAYTYQQTSSTAYKLCATFSLDSKDDSKQVRYEYTFQTAHKKGYDCIPYTISNSALASYGQRNINERNLNYLTPTPTPLPEPTALISNGSKPPLPVPASFGIYYPVIYDGVSYSLVYGIYENTIDKYYFTVKTKNRYGNEENIEITHDKFRGAVTNNKNGSPLELSSFQIGDTIEVLSSDLRAGAYEADIIQDLTR